MEEKEEEMKTTIEKLKEEVKILTTNKEQAVCSLRELMNIQRDELNETKDELSKTKEKLEETFAQLKTLQESYDSVEQKHSAAVTQHAEMQTVRVIFIFISNKF